MLIIDWFLYHFTDVILGLDLDVHRDEPVGHEVVQGVEPLVGDIVLAVEVQPEVFGILEKPVCVEKGDDNNLRII